MKKLLKFVSLMLVMAMILPMTPIEIFAVDAVSEQTQTPLVNADGTKTYLVDGHKKVSSDGTIGEDEYSVKADLSVAGYSSSYAITTQATSVDNTKVSEAVSLSFAHDKDKIYIGIYDKSGTGMIREGFGLRLGFDEAHPENYVGIAFMEAQLKESSTDTSKTDVYNALQVYDGVSKWWYHQASSRGIYRSNGNNVWYMNLKASDATYGNTVMLYTADTPNTYPMTAFSVVKEDVDGDMTLSDIYGRISSGQHNTYVEMAFDKDILLDYFNGMYESGKGIENLDTMLFSYIQCETQNGSNPFGEAPYTVWGGNFDEVAEGQNMIDAYNFDKVEFSDGTKTYSVNGYKTVDSNGTIGENEYSVKADLSAAGYSSSYAITTPEASVDNTKVSEAVSLSFAHDKDKIYIGIYDKSGTGMIREGFGLRLGFDAAHPENYVGIAFMEAQLKESSTDTSKTDVYNALQVYDGVSKWWYHQASSRGIYRSNGNNVWYMNLKASDATYGNTVMLYTADTPNTYPMTAFSVVKEDVDGDMTLSDIYGRISSGQHNTYVEMAFDKDILLDYFNGMYESGKGIENLDTMLFSYIQCETESGSPLGISPYTVWGGYFDELSEGQNMIDAYNFDKVEFKTPCEIDGCTYTDHVVKAAPVTDGTIYNVTGYKTVDSNGTIAEDEYSVKADLTAAGYSSSYAITTPAASVDNTKVSEEVSLSFAHDKDKIYIGIYDKSGTGMIREGFGLRLGFDAAHPENYVGITFAEQLEKLESEGSSKTSVYNALQRSYWEKDSAGNQVWPSTGDNSPYHQAGYRGIYRSNGNNLWYQNLKTSDPTYGNTVMLYTAETLNTYPMTAFSVVKEDVDGALTFKDVYGRITSGQHYTYVEMAFDKDLLLDYFNGMYEEGKGVNNLDTMLFSYIQWDSQGSSGFDAPYTVWGGSFDEVAEGQNMIDAYTFDMVRFKESDESTKYFHSCAVCGATGTTEFYADDLGNVVYKEAVSDSKYHRTEADCTTKESYWYSCTCGESSEGKANEAYFEVGEPLGHSFEFDGDTATCSVCGHVCVHEYEEGAANCKYCNIEKPVVACQHTTTEPVSGKDATCTETGLTAGTRCVDCGEMVLEQTEIPVDENAHDWNDGVVTTDPTCSVPGVKTYTCANNAEHTYNEPIEINADAHVWGEGVVTTDPTCMTAGEKTYTCSLNADHKKTEPVDIDANAHNFNTEVLVKDATGHWYACSNVGCQVKNEFGGHISSGAATEDAAEVCTVCGYEIAPKLDHVHNYNVLDKDETNHWYKCSCGVADEATREAHAGADDNNCATKVDCDVCGYEVIAAKAHDYTGSWNKDAEGHWHVCANAGCTVAEDKAGHVYDNDADTNCNDCGFVREVSGGDIGGGDVGGDDVGGGTTGSNSQTITSIGGSVNIEVTATYEKRSDTIDESPVYSVNISWDDMTFEYNSAAVEYTWNPDTLKYDIPTTTSAGGWTEKTAKIYIENRSNAAVVVTATWQAAEGVTVAPVLSTDRIRLESAVGCTEIGRTGEIVVSNPVTGSITGDCTLGTIVLEITAG